MYTVSLQHYKRNSVFRASLFSGKNGEKALLRLIQESAQRLSSFYAMRKNKSAQNLNLDESRVCVE